MLIDTHCHLNFHAFDEDRDAVVQRAQAAGVKIILNPAINLQTSRQSIALAERYSGVYAMVGIHPNDSATVVGRDGFDQPAMETLRHLADQPEVVAIGEIGLDYYWEKAPHEVQWAVLEAQLELAAELDLPVVIHCRDAHDDLRDVLRKWVPRAQKARSDGAILGVLHAYSGDLDMARESFEWGMVLSLGGPVTFRNARGLHDLVRQLPLDRLMLETDAPFLTPHPHRGKRNEPAYLRLIAEGIAELKGVQTGMVAEQTTMLAQRMFTRLPAA